MSVIKVSRHLQIKIPIKLAKKYNLAEGDYFEIEDRDGEIVLKLLKRDDPDEKYFNSPQWQTGETEADNDIAQGNIVGPFENLDDMLKVLEE